MRDIFLGLLENFTCCNDGFMPKAQKGAVIWPLCQTFSIRMRITGDGIFVLILNSSVTKGQKSREIFGTKSEIGNF